MIDVCTGPMSLKQLSEEIYFYMYHKSPEKLVVEITREKWGYHATLLMSKKDFEKPWQPPLPRIKK